MTARLAAAKTPQATSSQYLRVHERIADVADGLDAADAELVPQPCHTDLDDVRPGIERIAPDVLEQLLAPAHPAGLAHHVGDERELASRQRRRAAARVEDSSGEIEPALRRVELVGTGSIGTFA